MKIKIRCAICDKPVDAVEIWREAHDGTYRVVAECHGERDECVLDDYFLFRLHNDRPEVLEGEAFKTRKLAAA